MHSLCEFVERSKIYYMIFKEPWRIWQGWCFWTKQCIHFAGLWRGRKDVRWLSRSFEGVRQGWCF
jgi:hypothetical protein